MSCLDIPKAISHAAHVGLSLLDMPAEMGNEIYDLIFKDLDTMDLWELYPRSCEDGEGKANVYLETTVEVNERFTILYTCKQIYHEAGSRFYSNCKFFFGKENHRLGLDQTRIAAYWAMNLGTARHWLRRVHIDVRILSGQSAVSQPAMVFAHTSLDLSSITFTIWDLSAMKVFKYVDMTSEIPAIETLRLNNVLEILERDKLELKKYRPQLVAIRLMRINRRKLPRLADSWPEEVEVIEAELGLHGRDLDMNTKLRFVTKDDGKTFWPYTESISISLRRPLQNLHRIIIKGLLNYPKPLVTSLGNATSNLSRQDLRIVEVGSELCRQSREVRYDQNRFTVWLHTTHPRTSFEDSGGLMEAIINLLTALGHCAIRKSF